MWERKEEVQVGEDLLYKSLKHDWSGKTKKEEKWQCNTPLNQGGSFFLGLFQPCNIGQSSEARIIKCKNI